VADVVIDNPILNSPFEEPRRHFRFGEEGITSEIAEERRVSSYFMPIPAAKKKSQLHFDTEWTRDRIEENRFINQVRGKVDAWRRGGWPGATPTTRRLLHHWTSDQRERRLFFCQVEAVETAIYLSEAAHKHGDAWIANELRVFADDANPDLFRVALKMATGSGKTVVMGMLIAWQALNKLASPQDGRFSDAFLIVTPGITIKDRLRVLLPQDPESYYRVLDIVPAADRERLGQARIAITNFHAFQLRETGAASKTTKAILTRGRTSPFTETPDRMVRRVTRELGNKKNIVVLNDEAHHCYRRRAGDNAAAEKLTGDDRREAERRESEARVWISGLEAIQRKLGIRTVYDVSATPFFLRGSGYAEGTLFPWVVSDFSLIDAIESGIVKIPRVPVADDSMTGEQPTYRDLLDQPYENAKTVRVTGPFTVESLSPHRMLDFEEQPTSEETREVDAPFAMIVLDNLREAGVQNTVKQEHLDFEALEPFAGTFVHARGEFVDADGTSRTVAVCIGPEHGTVGADAVKEAAKEALKGVGFDLLLVCAFAFDAHAGETAKEFQPDDASGWAVAAEEKRFGKLPVLLVRMNPDLAMGDELLKKTGTGNLFMVFGEPDVAIERTEDGQVEVEIRGVDVYDPTTGQVRSSSVDDVACWFIDTNYNNESFFVRHAYFTGAEDPYRSLKRALRADIDEDAWASLYRTRSRPFAAPATRRIAVKVINHYGDEVLKVYSV